MRFLDRGTNPRAGGQIDHRIETMFGKNVLQQLSIFDVSLNETETVGSLNGMEPVPFQARVVVVIEVVDADNRVPGYEGELGRSGADEACDAGDKEMHG